MTTTRNVAEHNLPPEQSRPRSWGDLAVGFAHQMARDDFRRGDLAELRRMDPDAPDAAVFWRLLAGKDLLSHGDDLESKWALILHGIALMTPTNAGGRTAHDGYMPVGRALYSGGGSQQSTGFYSERRLNRLLTARGPMLLTLLARMFRMLAAGGVSFNWREMARFILNDGNEEAEEEARRRVARDYYQAERRSALSSSDEDN